MQSYKIYFSETNFELHLPNCDNLFWNNYSKTFSDITAVRTD